MWEREGNEKVHSHNSGKGVRGFHSWELTGTGIPAHPWFVVISSMLHKYICFLPQCSIEPQILLSLQIVAKNKMHANSNSLAALSKMFIKMPNLHENSDTIAKPRKKLYSHRTRSLSGLKKVLNLSFAPSRKKIELILVSSQPT